MSEVWKPVVGYEGRYEVSSLGRVRSVDHYVEQDCFGRTGRRLYKGRLLKQFMGHNGYLHVSIRKGHIYTHRAVAMAFVPGYFEGAFVNHIDENKLNNRADNLEWVTHFENLHHGTWYDRMKATHTNNEGKGVDLYTTDGRFVATYPSHCEAARKIGVSVSRLVRVVDKELPTRGYIVRKTS